MARRRWIVRSLALAWAALAVLIAASVVAFQDNLFRYLMDPHKPFQTTQPPPAPDYATDAAWALRGGEVGADEAAVFFVHPTTYWGGGAWNAAIDMAEPTVRLEYEVLPNYAAPFRAAGPVWAPRYRQASLFSSLTHRFDARSARALAYEDVARAFERFLAEVPEDAPIVLAGVEQGGLHVLGLLQHTAAQDQVRERLAAVYVINQAAPLDLFEGPLDGLTACRAPEAYGCVVTYAAAREDDVREINRLRDRSMTWSPTGRLVETRGRAIACVNPVLGRATEDFAPRRLHAGAADASGLGEEMAPAQMGAETSAQCREGVLLVDEPRSPSLRERWSWGGRFKPARANLFYADLRADAERRVRAFRVWWDVERLRAPPLEETVILREVEVHQVPD